MLIIGQERADYILVMFWSLVGFLTIKQSTMLYNLILLLHICGVTERLKAFLNSRIFIIKAVGELRPPQNRLFAYFVTYIRSI